MFKDISSEDRSLSWMTITPLVEALSWVVYNLSQNEIKFFQSLMHSV